ncbi:MAG: hypothetical protein WC441_05400 [Patescibacteria group bacterium]
MIEDYEQFVLHDKQGKNDIIMEVNWRPQDEKLNKCQVIRAKLGEKTCYLDKEELNAFLFVIGKPSEQRKMIPMTITKVRHYRTTVNIMATRDVRKGEIIRGPVTITLPSVSEEIIADVAREASDKVNDRYDLRKLLNDTKEKTRIKQKKEPITTYINETKQGIKKDE